MFRILWDPSSGSIERARLKLLVMFCVRSQCLGAWYLDLWCVCLVRLVAPGTHTTGPNITLPNTDYAHKTSQVISVKRIQYSLRMDPKGSETCQSF